MLIFHTVSNKTLEWKPSPIMYIKITVTKSEKPIVLNDWYNVDFPYGLKETVRKETSISVRMSDGNIVDLKTLSSWKIC